MRIFLIGFMGSGKSFVGRELAEKLEVSFIDLDEYLEKKEKKTISQIFEEKGEDFFRKKEKKYLREMSQHDNVIIATGGGTPCFFDNDQWMNQNGITLFLDAPVEVISQNLINGMSERPLLKDLNKAELEFFIEKKLKERSVYYENVHLVYERQIGGDNASNELAKYFSMFKS